MTGNDTQVFRNCTAFFFVANDALSVLENVGELGVSLPTFLKSTLIKLRDANDQSHELEDIPDESEDALTDDQSKDK